MKGEIITFRVDDSDVARKLQEEKENGNRSAFINKALSFYLKNNTAEELKEIKQMLVELKEVVKDGVNIQHSNNHGISEITEKEEVSPERLMLEASIEEFLY